MPLDEMDRCPQAHCQLTRHLIRHKLGSPALQEASAQRVRLPRRYASKRLEINSRPLRENLQGGNRVKSKNAWLAALLILPLPLLAQAPSVIPLTSEPHHHLVLHNSFVNLFDAKAAPGDSLLLHRHDNDAVAIAIGDQVVTIGVPGKPDAHSKNPDGQVRMQRSGYVHSTHVDGDAAYYTVAIELLHPQSGGRNVCAAVLAGQPLNCPDAPPVKNVAHIDQAQYESDQTRVALVRVLPHQKMELTASTQPQLIIALDPASISPVSGSGPDQALHPGSFVWFDQGGAARALKNESNKEVRLIQLTFKP
jgi:quercetin dioxygenase-like cupin family protein